MDPEAGRVTWSSAGHPPPLLWQAREQRVRELAGGGPILGRFGRARYSETSEALLPGDRILIFTDGIPEASAPDSEPFGDERLQEHLERHAGLDAEALADSLLERISAWTGRDARGDRSDRSGGFEDDLTLIVLGIGEG